MNKRQLFKAQILIIFLIILFICVNGFPVYAAIYTYDDLDHVTSVKYDSGQKITYTYDSAGNILSVSNEEPQGAALNASPIAITENNAFNQIFTLTLSSGSFIDGIEASHISLGGDFTGQAIGTVTKTASNIITVQLSGNLQKNTGTGSITVSAAATGGIDPITANVTVNPLQESVSAVNGTITYTLLAAPANAPVISDFSITQSINGAATVTITPTAINTVDKVVTLTVPMVEATEIDQSVVYSVSYQGGTSLTADTFIVPAQSSDGIDATKSTTAINDKLAPGASRTVTITIKDENANLITNTNASLKIAVTIVNDDVATAELYIVAGQDCSDTTIVPLNATSNEQGQITFDILMPSAIDSGDGLTVHVQTSIGSNVGESFTYPVLDECFIATAAYGSKFEPAVVMLRHFRDQYLLTNSLGKAFVDFYYHYSPPIAAKIADNNTLKICTRVALMPIIASVYMVYHPTILAALILSLILLCILYYRRKQQPLT